MHKEQRQFFSTPKRPYLVNNVQSRLLNQLALPWCSTILVKSGRVAVLTGNCRPSYMASPGGVSQDLWCFGPYLGLIEIDSSPSYVFSVGAHASSNRLFVIYFFSPQDVDRVNLDPLCQQSLCQWSILQSSLLLV